MCPGGTGPLGFLAPRVHQALQEKEEDQGGWARRAAPVKWAPQDLREARVTLGLLALLGRMAWQEPPDQPDHQGPQDPPGHQDQNSPQGLMTWKALGDPSGRRLKEPAGRRDRPARPESRGILE